MSTLRAGLAVTIPSGSTLDLTAASFNVGSFTAYNFSPTGGVASGNVGLPSYAQRAVFRVQVGTAAWSGDGALPPTQYPNGSLGIITSSADPKPVAFPGNAQALKLSALGGSAVVNVLFYEGGPVEV